MQPLTHHEILTLVGPFTRRGRHVDLAASDRMERRLVFKPVDHPGQGADFPAVRETLQFEDRDPGRYRLTRVLNLAGGLEARLQARGSDPAQLLARIETIPLQRQVRAGPGFVIAHDHDLEAAGNTRDGVPAAELMLTRGAAAIGGLTLTMRVPKVKGFLADVELLDIAGDCIELPQDLLAVLGLDWTRLERFKQGWKGGVRVRGNGSARGRDAETKFEQTVRHLATTLAEPPRRFHERMAAARWRVVLRRATPLLAVLGLFGGVTLLPRIDFADDSLLRMLIFNAPPLLLIFLFSMREVPRIEIPPLPRPATETSWRKGSGAVPTVPAQPDPPPAA